MSIKQVLPQWLASQAKLTAIVGTSPARIFPAEIPANVDARPAITYDLVSQRIPKLVDSVGLLAWSRIALTCWGQGATTASTYQSASELAEVLRQVLTGSNPSTYGAGFAGTQSYKDAAGDAQALLIGACRLEDARDLEVPLVTTTGTNATQRAVQLDFGIWHQVS